jgi:predicted MFS family arabinose efflux permease
VRTLAVYRGLLANRPLTKLLGGEFVSAIGDWLYIVALLVVIYQESGDPFVLGLFGAARVVPYIVLSIPAGIVADKYDRRIILLVTDLARGAAMLGMAAVVATGGPIWVVVALSIFAASMSTFFYPAIGAYIPNLAADERQLGPANSAWASLDNLGFVIGPVLGGVLVASGGTTFAFVINAATFLVIAGVLWRLPPSANVQDAADQANAAPLEAAPGREPPSEVPAPGAIVPIIGIASIRFMDGLLFGGVGVLTVVLATDILQAGADATGYLNAAIGIGGVAGAVVSGFLILRRNLAGPLLAGAVVLAAGAFALGMSNVLVAAMVAIVLISGGHLVLEVIATTLLQRVTTDAVRGRAIGALVTVETIAEGAGSFLLPVLVTSIGAMAVLGSGSALMVVAAIVGLVLIGGAATRVPNAFEATIARVAQLPLLVGVSAANLEAALDRVVAVPVAAGEAVIRQGEPADRFYIIESGSFVVRQAGGADETIRTLRTLGPGDVFGELGLLNAAPRSATVSAATNGVVLALDGSVFLAMVSGAASIRGRLLHLYDDPSTDRGATTVGSG